jgi:tRNA-dihydrouridine synthase B
MQIGNITIKNPITLSPMAGISDSPYRRVCREMGAGFSYTEFVSCDEISHHSKRALKLFQFSELERPIWFQIFGNNKDTIVTATKIIEELGPDAIDLNMGCSTSKVSQRGSGAGLLRNPSYVGEIIESMVKAVRIPITAKIRIGWDENNLNYKEILHVLEESGISMVSVHGRTKSMGYTGRANWDVIAEIKSIAKVPILGNGDIQSHIEAKDRIIQSKVDGVLIGRAGIGNPWIFAGLEKMDIPFAKIRDIMFYHLHLMLDFYGEEQGVILFRKHLSKYLSQYDNIESHKRKLLTSLDLEELSGLLYDLEGIVAHSSHKEKSDNYHCESFI